jgi:ElaB/YqjD/DUF883 family membrane-anchored ribosome-binding protein
VHRVETSLSGWLELYKELSETEELLSQATTAADEQAAARLRAKVAQLQAEADAAMDTVTAQIEARKSRGR